MKDSARSIKILSQFSDRSYQPNMKRNMRIICGTIGAASLAGSMHLQINEPKYDFFEKDAQISEAEAEKKLLPLIKTLNSDKIQGLKNLYLKKPEKLIYDVEVVDENTLVYKNDRDVLSISQDNNTREIKGKFAGKDIDVSIVDRQKNFRTQTLFIISIIFLLSAFSKPPQEED